MKPIDTEQLRRLQADGVQLAPGTIRTLIDAIDDYQKYPRAAGPAPTPPRLVDPDQVKLANQYAWQPNREDWHDNPVLEIIQQLGHELHNYASIHRLVVDPASIRIEFDDHGNGQATSRLVAYGKPKEQS